MKSNLKSKIFEFFIALAIILFFVLSAAFHKFPVFVLFLSLVMVISFLFTIFFNFSLKQYLSTVIIVLMALSILISILNQEYNLVDIETYIFPILGALTLAIGFVPFFKVRGLLKESISLAEMNKFPESLAILDKMDKILKSYPEDFNFDAAYFKAYALGMLEKNQESLEVLEELLEKKLNKNQKRELLSFKVSVLSSMGRYDEAEDIIEELLEEDPDNFDILISKAYILSKRGFKSESKDYYNNSLEIIDKNLLKYQSTIKKLKFLTENRNKILVKLWALKGGIQGELHQYPEALESFSEGLKLNPNHFMLWNGKGSVLTMLGQYDEALKCIEKSLKLYPENEFALISKGYTLVESGKPEESLEYYQKAIEINPLDEERYYNKGKAYQKLQQYPEALRCYNKVLELNPDCEYAKKARDEVLNVMEN